VPSFAVEVELTTMATRADVLVVGSGPLGATVARRLAEHGRTVLILEQGPAISDPPGSHVRKAVRFRTDPDAYLKVAAAHLEHFDSAAPRDHLPGASVTRAQGGQGVIWTNLCPRGDAPWDALTPAQWDEYYGVAETYLGVQADQFESSVRQQSIRARIARHLAAHGRRILALPVAARFDAGDQLYFFSPYDILAGSGEVGARVHSARATVHSLVVHGSRVAGVSVGNETIAAKAIVVASGAIGTPWLLHSSGIRPTALGRWLSYHPILITQLVLDEDLCAVPGVSDRVPRLQIPPTDIAEWYTLILRDVSPFEPKEPDVNLHPNRLVEMQLLCPIDVDERNGICFDDSSRPTFDVPLSSADESRLAGAEADADQLTEVLGRYRNGCRPTWLEFGFAHVTGTTRMSATDDSSGVADYNGRVWGFDNLFLATNGLIPTRMAVNPTLTGVALAARIAGGIANV
jgi:choline dehydrogenase-like flavoprotein